MTVILYWLAELAEEHRRRGELPDAAGCMRKALHHMGSEKGEQVAQASQLSDRLVDFLLEAGQNIEIRC